MISQVDSEGHHYQVLKDISDRYADGITLNGNNGFIRSLGGNLHAKNTTRGWKLEVKCKDVTLSWIPLKYLKASNPVELSEYAVVNNIEDKPAIKWWVKDFLCKKDQIIS